MDIYGHGNRGEVNDAEHWQGGGSNKLMISRLQLVLFLDLDHDLGPLLWFKQNYFLLCYESKTWRQIYPSCFTLWRGRRVVNSNRGGQDELGQEPGLHQNSEWGDHSGTLFQPFGQQRALSLLFWKRKRVTEWFPRTIFERQQDMQDPPSWWLSGIFCFPAKEADCAKGKSFAHICIYVLDPAPSCT